MIRQKRWTHVKPLTPLIGINDASFTPRSEDKVPIIGVVTKGSQWIEGVLQTRVKVDSQEITKEISKMIINSPHHGQLKAIITKGITMVGFGILNLDLLFEETNLPVVVVLTRLPDFSKIKKALKNFSDGTERWKLIENAGQPFSLNESKEIYLQVKGISEKMAKDLVIASTGKGKLPECLRIAHLVASSFKTL